MDLVVQQYLPEITEGEWSLIFFGGQYSHAVRKCPAEGDFRVQTHFGGSARAELPPETIVETAADILRDIPGREDPLYARVDGVERNGTLVL
ncbi:RimK family alpha-L-glutamate ligase, partial [Aeromonas dhakensis]|uniref:ATP-grasp domain-containing protein n=1 Tax=Aeromonas dhakensis TaxID=196024 RepID=UPI0038B4D6CE